MQRRNKSLFCVLLAVAMLFTTAVAYEFEASFDGDVLSINHDLTNGDAPALVYVFDTKVEPDTVIDEAFMQESLTYAGIQQSIEIELEADAPYGVYSIVLGSAKAGGRADRIKYVLRPEDGIVEEAISAIVSATDGDSLAETLISYNNKAYVLSLSELESAKTFMHNLIDLKDLDAATATVGDIELAYTEAVELSAVATGDSTVVEGLLVKYKDILGLDDDIEIYASFVADKIAVMEEIDSLAVLMSVAADELALEALNAAQTTETINVIDKYNHLFNVEFPKEFDEDIEYSVQKRIESTIFTDVTKVNDIVRGIIYEERDAYDEAIEQAEGEKKKTSTKGGEGSFYVAPSVTNPETIVESNASETSAFGDLAGYEWAQAAIEALFDKGIVGGDGSGSYRPADVVTREELVKIIVEALGGGRTEATPISFTDVDDEAWYKPYIATAYGLGIVKGIDQESFGVGKPVTRQDAATMILRAADAYYITFAKKQTLVEFDDYDDVSDYARVSVDTLARAKIINGFEDGTFRPKDSMNRAEIAKVIYGCISVN